MAGLGSRNSRASVLGFVFPPTLAPPAPDGDIANEPDRTHTAYSYTSSEATGAVNRERNLPDPQYYLITVAEIAELTDLTNIGIYDQSAYNTGVVYGN